MSSSYYMDAAASAAHHQPPSAASAMATASNWNHQLDYHQAQHSAHLHPHPPYYNHPAFFPTASHFIPQPQQHQQPQNPEGTTSHQPTNIDSAEAGGGLGDSYEKQPTPSESASSRSPASASNTTSTPALSDLAHRMGCFNTDPRLQAEVEAAAIQAAAIQSSYDVYGGGQGKVASGTGSQSWHPWMKNYNGKTFTSTLKS